MKQQDLKPALQNLELEIKAIPKKLYKYTGCNDENKEKRLNALRVKRVWLSYAKYLNDPFEGLSLYIDKLKLKEHGWGDGNIKELYDSLKSLGAEMLIGSFAASELKEDMPLWAHYAYDHKGYCLEYSVIKDTYIYPVLYENKRHLATKTLADFVMDAKRLKSTKESAERFLVIWSSFMIKHTVWQYEKEYRILKFESEEAKKERRGQNNTHNNSDDHKENEMGGYFSEKELGIALKCIYIGEKCPYKDELIKLGEERNCEIYEMVLNPYEEEFKLIAKKCL